MKFETELNKHLPLLRPAFEEYIKSKDDIQTKKKLIHELQKYIRKNFDELVFNLFTDYVSANVVDIEHTLKNIHKDGNGNNIDIHIKNLLNKIII